MFGAKNILEDEEELSETDKKLQELNDDNLNDKWVWFGIIEKLALGDITKFEEVYKQNYISALNLLMYWKEKEIIENKRKK